MATIMGIEQADGVVLTADRRHVEGDVVSTERIDRIQEHGAALAAAVGDPGNVAAFHRTLAAEIDRYRTDHDRAPTITALAEMAARVASSAGVEALVAARTASGNAELRSVDADGAVIHDTIAARGTGMQPALGALEGVDTTASIETVAESLQDVVATVHERDPESGTNGDVATLTSD
jgi:20S proteasome alpha/beta subunit